MRILTGLQPSGKLHLGNYFASIKQMVDAQNAGEQMFMFIANYHALTSVSDGAKLKNSTYEAAAAFLSLGIDPKKTVFWVQSDVKEVLELYWILSGYTPMGLLERAHAYKDKIAKGFESKHDLFSYPVLMAADILIFNATHIPVGRDQIQHVEMARDIAGRFNHRYRELFVLPEAVVGEDVPLLTGLDGRKMSKSYGNTIALFEDEKALRKQIMKIVTNSQEPGEPKNPDESTIYEIYRSFSSRDEQATMRNRYAEGIGWGDAKQALFEQINAELAEPRERYRDRTANPARIEDILQAGAAKARKHTRPLLDAVRDAVGIRPLR